MFFSICIICFLVKNLTKKNLAGQKPWLKKKEYNVYLLSLMKTLFNISKTTHFNFVTHFFKGWSRQCLVNILSLEQTCWTSIAPFFWRSWVKFFFVGEMCFVLSPLMYPPFGWAIHASLSSYNIVGATFFKERSHVYWMCWVINLNQLHSWFSSGMNIISAQPEEVTTTIYFVEHHDIDVPPHVNKYHVHDRTLWGSHKYHAST